VAAAWRISAAPVAPARLKYTYIAISLTFTGVGLFILYLASR
jgi:hypothetical protein